MSRRDPSPPGSYADRMAQQQAYTDQQRRHPPSYRIPGSTPASELFSPESANGSSPGSPGNHGTSLGSYGSTPPAQHYPSGSSPGSYVTPPGPARPATFQQPSNSPGAGNVPGGRRVGLPNFAGPRRSVPDAQQTVAQEQPAARATAATFGVPGKAKLPDFGSTTSAQHQQQSQQQQQQQPVRGSSQKDAPDLRPVQQIQPEEEEIDAELDTDSEALTLRSSSGDESPRDFDDRRPPPSHGRGGPKGRDPSPGMKSQSSLAQAAAAAAMRALVGGGDGDDSEYSSSGPEFSPAGSSLAIEEEPELLDETPARHGGLAGTTPRTRHDGMERDQQGHHGARHVHVISPAHDAHLRSEHGRGGASETTPQRQRIGNPSASPRQGQAASRPQSNEQGQHQEQAQVQREAIGHGPRCGEYVLKAMLKRTDDCVHRLSVHHRRGSLHLLRIYPYARLKASAVLRVKVERCVALGRKLGRHPNIAQVSEVFHTQKHLAVATPFFQGGELFEVVDSHHDDPLPGHVCARLLRQLLAAVLHCHNRGVCHRDISLHHVFLDDQNNIQLSGFGNAGAGGTVFGNEADMSVNTTLAGRQITSADLKAARAQYRRELSQTEEERQGNPNRSASTVSSRQNSSSAREIAGLSAVQVQAVRNTLTMQAATAAEECTMRFTEPCGSRHYAAPELVDGDAWYDGTKIDVWSIGIVFFALCTGQLPFDAVGNTELFTRIVKGELTDDAADRFADVPRPTQKIVALMLERDPAQRASIAELLNFAEYWSEYPNAVTATAAAVKTAASLNDLGDESTLDPSITVSSVGRSDMINHVTSPEGKRATMAAAHAAGLSTSRVPGRRAPAAVDQGGVENWETSTDDSTRAIPKHSGIMR